MFVGTRIWVRSHDTYGLRYWLSECKQLATLLYYFSSSKNWCAHNKFLQDARENLRSSMTKDAAAIKNEGMHIDEGPKCDEKLNSIKGESAIQTENELIYDFQRKISFSKNEQQGTDSGASSNKRASHGSLLGRPFMLIVILKQILVS